MNLNLAQIRKTLVGLAGALATAVAGGFIPAPYDKWASIAMAVLTALGVYQVPNAETSTADDTTGELDGTVVAEDPADDAGQVPAGDS